MKKFYEPYEDCLLSEEQQALLVSKAQEQGCINPCTLCSKDAKECEWKAWAIIEA